MKPTLLALLLCLASLAPAAPEEKADSKGQIAIQAEGAVVEFRKLDLTPLK